MASLFPVPRPHNIKPCSARVKNTFLHFSLMSTWWNKLVMQVAALGVMFFEGGYFYFYTHQSWCVFQSLRISKQIPVDVPGGHLENIREHRRNHESIGLKSDKCVRKNGSVRGEQQSVERKNTTEGLKINQCWNRGSRACGGVLKNWMPLSKWKTAGIHNAAWICLQCDLTSPLVNMFALWIGSLLLHILQKGFSNGTLQLSEGKWKSNITYALEL